MSTETASVGTAEHPGQEQQMQRRLSRRPARGEDLRAVALVTIGLGGVLLVPLVLQFLFALSYTGALHAPKPHHVPVAVVGTELEIEGTRAPARSIQ